MMAQEVQTKRDTVIERNVYIGSCAASAVSAEVERAAERSFETGSLVKQVYRTAGGAAASVDRAWTFHDVDLLEVERISRLWAYIAYAVDEDVVARAKAAQR